MKNNFEDIEQKVIKKAEERLSKKKAMRVSGKKVFTLKQIIAKKKK